MSFCTQPESTPFMHDVNRKKPDLVVLDDPISSFDKNKKFAILHELFRGKGSLQNTTTLMLTHDIEPAIDVVKSTAGLFASAKPVASFLSTKEGVISEVSITKDDIQTFAQICSRIVASDADTLIKAVYLRRHYEILDNMGMAYNLLASLLHKREQPTVKSIDQIMWNARHDADHGWKPYPRRYSIKGLYGAEGEEIYETAYWAAQGCPEDTELLASKWGYKFGKHGQPTKIEME